MARNWGAPAKTSPAGQDGEMDLQRRMKQMKSLKFMVCVVVISLGSLAFAQSDAQKSFDKLKTLAGTWQGPVTVDPPQHEMENGTGMQVSLRVTSRGNALVHEMKGQGATDDPTKNDHPVTMFY